MLSPGDFVRYFVPVNFAVISDNKFESASKIHFDTKKKIKKICRVDRKLKFVKVETSKISRRCLFALYLLLEPEIAGGHQKT